MTLVAPKTLAIPLPNGRGLGVGLFIMTEATKKTLKRVVDIVIAVLTALITTISAHAAGIVR